MFVFKSLGKWFLTGICVVVLSLCSTLMALAQDWEEMADTYGAKPFVGPAPMPEAVLQSLHGLLFVGTSQNSNDPAGTLNDIFTVDPVTDISTSVLSGVQVWGATADVANERILFTRASGLTPPAGQIGGGDELFEVPYAGGAPTSLGRIVDGAGEGFRVDGLAMSGGVLYGVNAGGGVENGFYSIDLSTLLATQISSHTDSISGIDADPDTGVIYGVNDTTGQLVTIATAGTITPVIAYPVGLADIDGLAVGFGYAYLVTDEAGTIPVYDIAGGVFVTSLTSPFALADVFSGGAIAVPPGGLETTMYATDDDLDNLYDLDPDTGVTTLIGACGMNLSWSGMAYDSTNGVMYVSDVQSATGFGLASLDLATGVATYIGDHVNSVDIFGLAYNPDIDVLYGADFDSVSLATIDRATGVSTAIGPWGGGQIICGLTYNQDTGVLYASDSNSLYTVDEGTGAATLVGAHNLAFANYCALEYNPVNGLLYVAGNNQPDLNTLDMATGAATAVGPTGLAGLNGMAMVVPASTTGNLAGQLSFIPDLMGTDPSGFLIEATPVLGGVPISTTTDGIGNWSMDVPPDTYQVTATSLDWLGALYPAAVVSTGVTTTLPNPVLLGGDFDDSGDVGVVDVTYVASRYGGGDLSADINRSGDVGLVDVTSTASNYGSTAPVPWP